MYKPTLEINLTKLRDNAVIEKRLLAAEGVEIMAVNKVFNGCIETAQAIYDAGITTIAESRLHNLKKLHNIGCTTCLLRSPCLSEIDDVVRYADISLNSEIIVIQALSAAAVKQNKNHQILLMIDMGDLREGIWFADIEHIISAVSLIQQLPNISLYGLGTNFSCYGTVLPTVQNGEDFVQLVNIVKQRTGVGVKWLSAGNCTSYHLIDKGLWPSGLNHLRIGGLHQFGIEYVEMKYVDAFHHSQKAVSKACSDLYKLKVEIIELNRKPTVPVGELGVDAFLQPKEFVDQGIRQRAILAFGRQDVPIENCVPEDDSITILGQTSDHTLVDIETHPTPLSVGDTIGFELDYTGLLMACQSSSIKKIFMR